MELVPIINKEKYKDNKDNIINIDDRIKAVVYNSKEADKKFAITFKYKILLFQTTIETYMLNNSNSDRWNFYRDDIIKKINNVVHDMYYTDSLNITDIIILAKAKAQLKANIDILKYALDSVIILNLLDEEKLKNILILFSTIENMVGGRIKQLANKINNYSNPDYDRRLALENKKKKKENKTNKVNNKESNMPKDILEHPLWNKLSDDVKNYYIEINNIDI